MVTAFSFPNRSWTRWRFRKVPVSRYPAWKEPSRCPPQTRNLRNRSKHSFVRKALSEYASRVGKVTIEFVRSDVLCHVHGRLLDRSGGLPGLRDENALELAVGRPEQVAGVTSIASLGAAVARAILHSHPFVDGNQRSSFAALTIFADINSHHLTCSEVEKTAMDVRAASEITEAE